MNRAHDDTSEALLTAARKLLADQGPEALTVRRIASENTVQIFEPRSTASSKDAPSSF